MTTTRASGWAWFNYPFLTQKERDVETGLDYFLARYYSSKQGRFTSPDEFKGGPDELYVLGTGDEEKQALPYAEIVNPQSLNKYTYVYNNPLRFTDPDGHQGQIDWITHLLRWFVRQLDPQTEAEQPRRHGPSLDADKATTQTAQALATNYWTAAEEAERYNIDFGTTDLARKMAKGDRLGTAVAAAFVAVNVLTLGEGRSAVVIGEQMEARVIPAAAELGAKAYRPLLKAVTEESCANFVSRSVSAGKRVFDIGPASARITSGFYQAELKRLTKLGFERVFFEKRRIGSKTLEVYEWVKKAPK